VSLELALARVPTVIAYRTGRLTAAVVRRLIRVSHIALPNILAGRTVMPEFVQENCTPETLSDALGALLKDAGAREAQRAALAEIGRQLGADGPAPSLRAADAVLEVVERSRSSQLRV
jgi:lipid-A-disaccharide synthase